jgi:arsenical pump membrane protein
MKHASEKDRLRFMRNVLLFVFAVRVSLFVASFLSIPVSLMAVFGSLVLLGWRWAYLKNPTNRYDQKNAMVYYHFRV